MRKKTKETRPAGPRLKRGTCGSGSSARIRRKILLVDDHPLLREGIAHWINRAPDLQVCGEAGTAEEAVEALGRLKPDLVLMDLSLPGRSGLEFIKDLQVQRPGLPILVLSMHDESLHAGRALRAGARGYVMKAAGGAKVVEAIREVLRGRIALSPEMATRLLEELAGRPVRAQSSELSLLTDREFEIFQLLGEAKSNQEIARQIHLSPKTVETHRIAIRRKLKLASANDLLRYAIQYVQEKSASHADLATIRSPSGPDHRAPS